MINKHICIISPSLKVGGIERVLTGLADFFVSENIKVSFISCLKHDRFYHLNQKIDLFEPGFQRNKNPLNKLIFYPRLIFFIRRMVMKLNPDVVLTFGDGLNTRVLLALHGTKIPVFISDRTSPDYKFKFPIPQMKKWLYPSSKGMVAQTYAAAEYKRKQFNGKLNIKVIPNFVRPIQSYDIPREKIILYVGRFAWEKGPERLIKAFAGLAVKDDWQLVMAGSGPLLDEMKNLSRKLNLGNSIHFPGKIENVDLLYARASIFVLPSVLEGFPNSLIEAMAAGLPCVCFDSFPANEIINNNFDGIILQDGNIPKMTETLQFLIQNEDERKRLGENAKKISEKLSIERIGHKFLELLFE